VAVEKLGFPKIIANSGDRKCLCDPRKSFVGHPDALRFWQISRKRVFQQPQAFSPVCAVCSPKAGLMSEMPFGYERNGDVSPTMHRLSIELYSAVDVQLNIQVLVT
jgi:hypothetical protein